MDSTRIYIGLFLINLPIFFVIGKLFFKDLEGLITSIRFLITPRIISAFRGEFDDDWIESLRFIIFALLCALLIIAEKALLKKYF